MDTVTSVAMGRSRNFSTPGEDSSYSNISIPPFAADMDILQNISGGKCIAVKKIL